MWGAWGEGRCLCAGPFIFGLTPPRAGFVRRDPKVIAYVRKFAQTQEFLSRVTDLLLFLLPHYIHEGKSYLTVAFGCTGGQHRSVMIAEEMRKRLTREGYRVKATHRDMPR